MCFTVSRVLRKMKVFFPQHCLNYESGFIFGWRKKEEETLFAVTVLFVPSLARDFLRDFDTFCEKTPNLHHTSFLGIWFNENKDKTNSELVAAAKVIIRFLSDDLVLLRLPRHSSKPLLYFLRGTSEPAVLTLYKQPLVNAFLTAETLNLKNDKFCQKSFSLSPENALTHFPGILVILNKSREAEKNIRLLFLNESKVAPRRNISSVHFLILWAAKRCRSFVNLEERRISPFWPRAAKFLCNSSAVCLQSRTRLRQLKALCDNVYNQLKRRAPGEVTNPSRSPISSKLVDAEKHTRVYEFPVVSFGNLVTSISLDTVLGLAFVLWFFSHGFETNAAEFIMKQTEVVVQFLSALLEQLKGAPVGLKLNKQLSECLSTFFLWHIYLWKSYLSFMEPHLQTFVGLTLMSGCFGITFLLSLASDVLSLLTLHIYCFYGYAAKLYRFQVQKLITLARLFTGRKWSVERNCVEAVPYKVDQLFIGTLLFAVLLFLLPTTAVFYIVLTLLRIMVLLVKGLINKAVDALNNLPLFALFVAFAKPDLLPGNVMFEVLDAPEQTSPEFYMEPTQKLTPVPVVYLCLHYQPLCRSSLLYWRSVQNCLDDQQDTKSWSSLLEKVVRGELIYPWINKTKTVPEQS